MNTFTLKLFNTGQVTLPKSWREKFKTEHFLAKETKEGLLIKPITEQDEPIYFENNNSFGLVFPNGIDPQVLIDQINKMDE